MKNSDNIVRIGADGGPPVCPACGRRGVFYGQNGQSDSDPHQWVWEVRDGRNVLVAYPRLKEVAR